MYILKAFSVKWHDVTNWIKPLKFFVQFHYHVLCQNKSNQIRLTINGNFQRKLLFQNFMLLHSFVKEQRDNQFQAHKSS